MSARVCCWCGQKAASLHIAVPQLLPVPRRRGPSCLQGPNTLASHTLPFPAVTEPLAEEVALQQ